MSTMVAHFAYSRYDQIAPAVQARPPLLPPVSI